MARASFLHYKKSGLWRWNDVNDNKKIPKSGVDQQDIHTEIKLL